MCKVGAQRKRVSVCELVLKESGRRGQFGGGQLAMARAGGAVDGSPVSFNDGMLSGEKARKPDVAVESSGRGADGGRRREQLGAGSTARAACREIRKSGHTRSLSRGWRGGAQAQLAAEEQLGKITAAAVRSFCAQDR